MTARRGCNEFFSIKKLCDSKFQSNSSFNLHHLCSPSRFSIRSSVWARGRVNKTCAQMFTAKYYYHISNSSTKLGHELDSFQKLAQLCNETIVLAGSGRGGGAAYEKLVAFGDCRGVLGRMNVDKTFCMNILR